MKPGSAARLPDRAAFDDGAYNYGRRKDRAIVKGRFQGGTIGYVTADELQLYAAVYRKTLPILSEAEEAVLNCVERDGPLYKEQIAEETGLRPGVISKAVTRLQGAFLVHADHGDAYDEQLWFYFASEFPDADPFRRTRAEALPEILARFAGNMVFITLASARDWSRLPLRDVTAAVDALLRRHLLTPAVSGGTAGWILSADAGLLSSLSGEPPPPSVFVLHRADYMVRAHESALRERFGGTGILEYLLIDGRFQGALTGRWRIGPYDVDDIALTLPPAERIRRRDEILDAVGRVHSPPGSHILRYDGVGI